MAILKWDPLKDLMSIQDRMNRLFEEVASVHSDREGMVTGGTWTPPCDIYETPGEFMLKIELAGVDPEHVAVEVQGTELIIQGERKYSGETAPEHYHRVERSHGRFFRKFNLPGKVRENEVTAKFSNGLLSVTLPKTGSEQVRIIRVEKG